MDRAFLVGLSRYPDHRLPTSNDVALLSGALTHRGYPRDAIGVFDDSHTTHAALLEVLAHIRTAYTGVRSGSCYVHVGASGACSSEPVQGGILPIDGDALDFATALPFATLNQYLPVRDGVRVIVTLDT